MFLKLSEIKPYYFALERVLSYKYSLLLLKVSLIILLIFKLQ